MEQCWVIYEDDQGISWEALNEKAFRCLEAIKAGTAQEDIDPGEDFSLEELLAYGRDQGFIREG
jgi:hypothetical protein